MSQKKLFNELYNFFLNVNKMRRDIMKKENPMDSYELFDEDESQEDIIRKGMCQYEDLIKKFKRNEKSSLNINEDFINSEVNESDENILLKINSNRKGINVKQKNEEKEEEEIEEEEEEKEDEKDEEEEEEDEKEKEILTKREKEKSYIDIKERKYNIEKNEDKKSIGKDEESSNDKLEIDKEMD